MMYNSGGALLKEAYGSDNIRMKKKDKKKKDLRYFPERGVTPIPEQLQPMEEIDKFDQSFHQKSNIMPFGTSSDNNYYNLNEEDTTSGSYFPFQTHKLDGKERKISLQQPKEEKNEEIRISSKEYVEHKQPYPWDKGIKISEEDYRMLQEYKLIKEQKDKAIITEQIAKSQNSEGFSNVNDDFNDVLLFGLLGVFFLIFTDYVYKLGRKSY